MPQNTAPLVSWHGEHAKVPLPLRLLGRYFITGRALRGGGDNATLLHRATMDYRARPYVKLSAPVWQRLARRHVAITVPLAMAMATPFTGLAMWMVATYLATLILATLIWTGHRVWLAMATHRRNKEWVDPASRTACDALGIRWTRRDGRRMVAIPADWGNGQTVATLHLPVATALTKNLKEKLVATVGARLGIPAPVTAEWFESGGAPFVLLSAAPVPPREVTWASMAKAVANAEESEIVIGRVPGGGLAKISLAEDSPHIGLSGAAGTGKSVAARVMLAPRVAFWGDGLLITDPKKFSHWRWAGGGKVDPNRVRYAWRTEELHQAWLDVAAEVARRIELDEDELAGQRRVFILVEEANVQAKKLIRHWRGLRKAIIAEAKLRLADDPYADIDLADLDPPIQSPAIVAMQEAICMGRELKIHVVVAAQRMSASVFGGNGGDIRESFQGGRLLAKWDRKLWKMLVDTIDYRPFPNGPRGIWGLARGDEFLVLRVPFMSEDEALALVTSSAAPVYGPVLGVQQGAAQVDGTVGAPAITSAVTLAAALDLLPGQDGPAALSLAGLRDAAGRGKGFPAPLDKPDGKPYARTEARLYALDELIEWREECVSKAP